MNEPVEYFDPAPVLKSLKDFQRRTVRHAFEQLYLKPGGSRRFLVADEVGLGKTLVARGVIARAIRHLEEHTDVDRIDIVYVCSNAAIAQQNVNRLNVTGKEEYAVATRLTLLPLELPNLGNRKLNFVSFTPGTTFDLKYSTGRWEERRLLFQVLRKMPDVHRGGLMNLLQCDVGRQAWCDRLRQNPAYDKGLIAKFLRLVRGDKVVMSELVELTHSFKRVRQRWPEKLRVRRNQLIASLRKTLAKSCVDALEPDLVILDEFQRFRALLSDESEAGELAQELMGFQDVRVLMLSATPYKMLTLYDEEENHFEDFIRTLNFLFAGDQHQVEQLRADLDAYREALYLSTRDGPAVRDRLQNRLKKVMARTERVPVTRERDAMLREPRVETTLKAEDLHRARALDQLVRKTGASEAIEYWKSAPFLINFMKGYAFKQRLVDQLEVGEDLNKPLRQMVPHLLSKSCLEGYEQLDPGNARLRALVDRTLSHGEWKQLWLPPSLAYVETDRYRNGNPITKSLVFSTWSVVPDVIAAVCSYIAERNRVLSSGPADYFDLYNERKPRLVFRKREGKPATMSSLTLLYPSPVLSGLIDPLQVALESGRSVPADVLLQQAEVRASGLVETTGARRADGPDREDHNWYWWIPAQADKRRHGAFSSWVQSRKGWRETLGDLDAEGSVFSEHVDHFLNGLKNELTLSAIPDDLATVLAELALGSPAVCAHRALRRVAPDLSPDDHSLLSASAAVAEGFRSLFNSPDVRSLLENDDIPYWRKVLHYCAEYDLQAVLDEYVHTLRESLGLINKPSEDVVSEIGAAIQDVLSIRTSSLEFDEVSMNGGRPLLSKLKMRCRYALRFADFKDESEKVLHRAGVVRHAFNSPFRPFILATTSIGQEGLDFHNYCHRVWHWNLPQNPVDLEQREGRVNRYKGHAVRKNVARAVGLSGLAEVHRRREDPWERLFHSARRKLEQEGRAESEIKPFWIFEEVDNPSRVERLVPLPPFSSEHARFRALKKSLAVYRLAFGQPRQEDLVEFLADRADGEAMENYQALQLDLSP